MVCLGSNDIANTYYSTPVRSSHYDISAYTDLMVNSASNFFQVNSKHLFNNENKLSHVVGLYWVTWSTYDCQLVLINGRDCTQELYGQGARRIGVLSMPPIGCVPSQRTVGGGIERGCSEICNQAARLFNSKLSSQIDSLNKKLPDARLVYLDIYNKLLSLIQNPSKYGNIILSFPSHYQFSGWHVYSLII